MSNEKEENLLPEDQIPQTLQPSPAEQLPAEEGAAPGGQPKKTAKPRRKLTLILQFVLGLLGWFLANGLLWQVFAGSEKDRAYYEMQYSGNIICFPANLLVLIVLALIKETRPIALGILAAIGLNFLISLFLGITENGLCLLPFFS